MIEVKNNFNGGLNLDDSLYLIPNNSYIDALNVTRDAIEGSNDRALTNIVGNQNVAYSILYDANINTNIEQEAIGGGTNAVTITFSGNEFIPPGYTVNIYKSGGIKITQYTTESTIPINSLLANLCNSLEEYGFVTAISFQNNQLFFEITGATVTAINFIYLNELLPIRCIGAYSDSFRNTVIYFLWAESGYHSIVEYDNSTRTNSPIFTNLLDSNGLDILGFTEHNKINSINVYHRNIEEGEGDILFFLDSLGRPTVMDILRFKNGEYTPVIRDIIDVAKRPPLLPPSSGYSKDTTRNTNSLKDKLFRFKYRYVYDNNEKSTCSPISLMPIPLNILDVNKNNNIQENNLITIGLNTGDKDVKAVELLMSYVNKTNDWSDFASVDTIYKTGLGLTQTNKVTTTYDPDPVTNLQVTFNDTNGLGVGTEVKIYFYNSSGENVLVAEYISLAGDDATDVAAGLVADSIVKGFLIYSSSTNNILNIPFNTDPNYPPIWAFNELVINNNVDGLAFNYSFYNDGAFPIIDVNESIQLFDYVPDQANAQEMPNGNVLLYGGITEGYDRTLNPNVVNEILTKPSGVSSVGQLSATWRWEADYNRSRDPKRVTFNWVTFSGVPVPGSTIEYYFRDEITNTTPLGCSLVTVVGDTAATVATKLLNLIASLNQIVYTENSSAGSIYFEYNGSLTPIYPYHVDSISILEPSASNTVIPTFLNSTNRKLGIAYFDKKGKTNGILYSGELEFPKYSEEDNEMLLPYINTRIFHKPPEWAYSYGFYLSKENTQFLYWLCIAVKNDSKYYYFDISNLELNQTKTPTKTAVLSWSFQDGDRIRILKRVGNTPAVMGDTEMGIEGIVKDPGGSIPPGTYIKTLKTTAFTNLYLDTKYLIQIYRNNQQKPGGNNEVYYEFGQQYLIGNPTLPSRYHRGMDQDQGIAATFRCDKYRVANNITLSFAGTVLSNTYVSVRDQDGANLAEYTTVNGDGIETIVDELISQLSLAPGIFLSISKPSTTQIEVKLTNSSYDINVIIVLPTPEQIPAEFNFYDGDVYFKSRTIFINNNDTDTYLCLDRNIIDDYYSAVNNVNGRSNVIDINAKRAYYSTLVRFSNAYQANTNINGTNRFYPNNFDEYDYSFGDVMRFKVRDRFVRVFQKNKVGQVPLYNQILKEQNKENLVVTDKLLNPIQYYVGDVGIGDNPESLASYNFADYFVSNKRGVICRVSNNGVEFLSVLYKINSWTTEFLPSRTGNYKVYGVFDNRLGDYIVSLEATDTDSPYTLMFDEDLNSFSTFLSYHPEMMTCLNTLLITFKDGILYTHDNPIYNNFYNVQYDSNMTTLFNQNPLDKKTFLSLSQIGSNIWACPEISTDINMYGNPMQSNLIESDFDNLEGTYEAAILSDINSPGGVYSGDSMKGKYMVIKFNNTETEELIKLNSLSLKYINSPLNNR